MPYNPEKDFAPVSLTSISPLILVVNNDFPAKTVGEFIAYAKANPSKVFFGSSGSATTTHLAGEILNDAAGITMTHVPFKGSGPALTALAGSDVTFGFTSMPSAMPLILGKRLRPIAVTSTKRIAALPDIPTMAEAGVAVPSDLDIREWYGVLVPAATAAST